MKKEAKFVVTPSWSTLFKHLNVPEIPVLRRAGLPTDLFYRKGAELTTREYFRLWRAFEDVIEDKNFAIKFVKSLNLSVFEPPIFAACCSPDLTTAIHRIKDFKPLIAPIDMAVDQTAETTTVRLSFFRNETDIPISLSTMELGFFVQLARLCTGQHIRPIALTTPGPVAMQEGAFEFFECAAQRGDRISITFSNEDCGLPFVTENNQMWTFFEEGLQKRLIELKAEEQMSERVRAALLELLPCNQASVDAVAKKLFVSRRTLQRRLKEENTSFKGILTGVREDLALHYIKKSDLPYNQISFLLGYEDPNSFFRAFNGWTGTTPDTVRTQYA